MDVLGEDIFELAEATAATAESLRVLEAEKAEGLEANLSIKLTSLGLRIDKEACYQNVRTIVSKAAELGNFVRIDMEDSSTTDDTLEIYRRIRKEFDNCGVVIQAYLKRSVDDVQALIEEGIAHLRVCKGIYIEPAEIAYKDRQGVRENFVRLIQMMLESKSYIGIATHDKWVVDESLKLIEALKCDLKDYEFQMLLGVTEHMRDELVARGHKLRVYVPYGEQWHAYSMRRLKENPQIAGHIIKNLFIRG
jgi:proline dehydrogenase